MIPRVRWSAGDEAGETEVTYLLDGYMCRITREHKDLWSFEVYDPVPGAPARASGRHQRKRLAKLRALREVLMLAVRDLDDRVATEEAGVAKKPARPVLAAADSMCPHPARDGRHEVYLVRGGKHQCRACGSFIAQS